MHVYNKFNKHKQSKCVQKATLWSSGKRVLVLMYCNRNAFRTAACINYMLVKAQNPSGIRFVVYEEAVHRTHDVRYFYRRNYSTTQNYISNIKIVTKPVQTKKPPSSKIIIELVKAARQTFGLRKSDIMLWISTKTAYIISEWDSILQNMVIPNCIGTSVPCAVNNLKGFDLEETFRSTVFLSEPKFDKPLPLHYLSVNSKGCLKRKPLIKKIGNKKSLLKTPLLHPYFVFGKCDIFVKSIEELSRQHIKTVTQQLGCDLSLTGLLGWHQRLYMLPLVVFAAKFKSTRPPVCKKKNRHLFWNKWLCDTLGIDLYKKKIAPEIQLGLWPNNALNPEKNAITLRMLAIIVRHGSEQEYRYKLQKIRALSKHPQTNIGLPSTKNHKKKPFLQRQTKY